MGGTTARSLDQARREHRTLAGRLADLSRLAHPDRPSSPGGTRLREALDAFLAEWEPRLTAHLAVESRLVAPRVGVTLPDETGTLERFRNERESFAVLLQLLKDGRGWLARQEPGAEAEVAAALRDLTSLWDEHVRRAAVLDPILSRLEGSNRG